MLYIVATPIGNLGDLSKRAIETLQQVDLILCEDTRYSRRLLTHYQIAKPLLSFHRFSEAMREEKILDRLRDNAKIALISNAGTPLVSDPGASLVQACLSAGLPITIIPGACSPIAALVLSGFATEPFQFIGFLPRKGGGREKQLRKLLAYEGTSITFESPYRLVSTLEALEKLDPTRILAVVREITKIHEECRKGTATELLAHFRVRSPKGEIILLIAGTEA